MTQVSDTTPAQALARSPFYRKLIEQNATFSPLGETVVAQKLGGELSKSESVHFCDLSAFARSGFKGNGTTDWLASKGLNIPETPNQASRQKDGTLLCRLSDQEYLLLSNLDKTEAGLVETLDRDWPQDHAKSDHLIGYPLPRQDSHNWLYIQGVKASEMFAKICGVDLRTEQFSNLAIAQTIAARLGVIIIRDDRGHEKIPGYHFLTDSASSAYIWDVLMDACAEFEGEPVGLTELKIKTA